MKKIVKVCFLFVVLWNSNVNGMLSIEELVTEDAIKIIKERLSSDISIDKKDSSGRTALFLSVMLQRYEVFDFLLQIGASVDKRDKLGNTSLHVAVAKKAPRYVEKLLSAGADPENKGYLKATPFSLACLDNENECRKAFEKYGYFFFSRKTSVPNNVYELLKDDAKEFYHYNEARGFGCPLWDQVENSLSPVFNYVHDQKQQISSFSESGIIINKKGCILKKITIQDLHYVFGEKIIKDVEKILAERRFIKSEINNFMHQFKDGLVVAKGAGIYLGEWQFLENRIRNIGLYIRDKGIDEQYGQKLLKVASRSRQSPFVNLIMFLLAHDIKPSEKTVRAALLKNNDIALKHFCDYFEKSKECFDLFSILEYARVLGHKECEKVLCDALGKKLCAEIMEHNCKEVVKLVSAGANINVCYDGMTPLHYAVKHECKQCVKALLEGKANVQTRGKNDKSVLFLAMQKVSPYMFVGYAFPDIPKKIMLKSTCEYLCKVRSIIKLLLKAGASVHEKYYDINMLQQAKQYNDIALAKMFIDYGILDSGMIVTEKMFKWFEKYSYDKEYGPVYNKLKKVYESQTCCVCLENPDDNCIISCISSGLKHTEYLCKGCYKNVNKVCPICRGTLG